jgi:hypothetical protein
MTPLALVNVQDCNKCGVCCMQGGACVLRNGDGQDRPIAFEGRCELLADEPDGSTRCRIMLLMREGIRRFFFPGKCDFPQWRKELRGST